MAEFIKAQSIFEHYCPENWIPDPDNLPHEMCSICGKKHMLSNEKVRALKQAREQSEAEYIETYEIEVHTERKPGKDWDGQWVTWESKKRKNTTWQSPKRIKSAMAQAVDVPAIYRIVKVLTKPAVEVGREVVEVVDTTDQEVDFKRQDFSKRNLDEAQSKGLPIDNPSEE